MFGCLQVSNGQTGQAVLGSVLDSVRQRLLASIMLVAVRYLLDVSATRQSVSAGGVRSLRVQMLFNSKIFGLKVLKKCFPNHCNTSENELQTC